MEDAYTIVRQLISIAAKLESLCGSLYKADSRFAPSQWETALLCNDVSHWLGASLASALYCLCPELMFTGPIYGNKLNDNWITKHIYFTKSPCWVSRCISLLFMYRHEEVMSWLSHILHNWPFVTGIHQSPMESPHTGPVMQSYELFLCCHSERLLNKQWICGTSSVRTPTHSVTQYDDIDLGHQAINWTNFYLSLKVFSSGVNKLKSYSWCSFL